MTDPTRFVPVDVEGISGLYRNEVNVSMPAPDMVKGGWRMFWLGVWAFLRRRDVTWTMGWFDR